MRITHGDLLDAPPGAIIFHQVNTLGIMGAGLALQIKRKWPEVFKEYQAYCTSRTLAPRGMKGTLLGTWLIGCPNDQLELPNAKMRQVCHLFAQDHLRKSLQEPRATNYTALAMALQSSAVHWAHRPCYFPYGMGCGLAGGDWKVVSALIEENYPNAILVRK